MYDRRHSAVAQCATASLSWDTRPWVGWSHLRKSVTLGNVTMSHRTRESSPECLASPPIMIGLRAQH
ncbi:hypothetical protein EVAR_9917_1 [Eumeta japonica]|uniref:Uncharacterized protein n=1 Tax=Eumeta variegata TaxID=151549 RepID=A0A4C1TQL5_EUMVA|nr:hypothetical protein EVAR_9917_1 [Eumeta japonica]